LRRDLDRSVKCVTLRPVSGCGQTFDPDLVSKIGRLSVARTVGVVVGLFLLGRGWLVPRQWLVTRAGAETNQFSVRRPDAAYALFVKALQSSIG
jgi:hypothetical protein